MDKSNKLFSNDQVQVIDRVLEAKYNVEQLLKNLKSLREYFETNYACDCENYEDPVFCNAIKQINHLFTNFNSECSKCVEQEKDKLIDLMERMQLFLKKNTQL